MFTNLDQRHASWHAIICEIACILLNSEEFWSDCGVNLMICCRAAQSALYHEPAESPRHFCLRAPMLHYAACASVSSTTSSMRCPEWQEQQQDVELAGFETFHARRGEQLASPPPLFPLQDATFFGTVPLWRANLARKWRHQPDIAHS